MPNNIRADCSKECPMDKPESVPIMKKEQGTSQSIEESCPIPSVPVVEKTKTSLDKEGETKATGSGNISVDGGKTGEIKTSDKMETQATSALLRQEKRQLDKKSRHGDKDSEVSNSSNRSWRRSKRKQSFSEDR